MIQVPLSNVCFINRLFNVDVRVLYRVTDVITAVYDDGIERESVFSFSF